jgi:DNA-binding MarR family transcriptional regulator
MTDPTNDLDDVVHQRIRLGILTILHEAGRVQFGYLEDALGLTAGNLSQHLTVLGKAGLVKIEKGYENNRARTWVSRTRAGTDALRDEIRVLKSIVARIEGDGQGASRQSNNKREKGALQ